jgi:hypothetical protein
LETLEKPEEILDWWKRNSSKLDGCLTFSSGDVAVWFKAAVVQDGSRSNGLVLVTLDGTKFKFPLRDATFAWEGLKESGFAESSFAGVLTISLGDRAEITLGEKLVSSMPLM